MTLRSCRNVCRIILFFTPTLCEGLCRSSTGRWKAGRHTWRLSDNPVLSYTAIHCHQERYTQYGLIAAISLGVASLKKLCGRTLPWTDIHEVMKDAPGAGTFFE